MSSNVLDTLDLLSFTGVDLWDYIRCENSYFDRAMMAWPTDHLPQL